MPRGWKIAAIAAFAAGTLALFGALAYGLENRSPATGRSGIMRVGKPAPDFAMRLLGEAGETGDEFRLADAAGTPLVINFWASWCPPCRDESPAFERQWRLRRDDGGILFVGVNTQDAVEDGEAYIREFGLSFPNGRDPNGRITVDYGVIGLPVTFFVDASGIVRGRKVGAITEDELAAWADRLTAQ